ncbi:MAG: ABC transporter permease [Actinomycetota bacterium]|nr:ABC transporter permease [Actinomycetota bacterium]
MTLAQERPFFDWEWVVRNADQIVDRTWEHIYLTAVPVGLGFIIALALSVVALRWRRTYAPITLVTGILYTIPSLATFAFLVPIVGLNATNAIIALTSYTLLILIRNIVAGIDGVPPSILEAADGMGYTRSARFWRMEVPLALPVIVAGLRIATVTTVGLVTITAVLGLGGYGFFILRGFNSFFITQTLVGVFLSVVLATILDLAFVWLQRRLTPWQRGSA